MLKTIALLIVSLGMTIARDETPIIYDDANQTVSLGGRSATVISNSVVEEKLSPYASQFALQGVDRLMPLSAGDIVQLIAQDNLRTVSASIGLFMDNLAAQSGRLIMTYDVRNCHVLILRSADRKKAALAHVYIDNLDNPDSFDPLLKKFVPTETDVFILTAWVTPETKRFLTLLSGKGFTVNRFYSNPAYMEEPYGKNPKKYVPYGFLGSKDYEGTKGLTIQTMGQRIDRRYLTDMAFGLDTKTGDVVSLSNSVFKNLLDTGSNTDTTVLLTLRMIDETLRKKVGVEADPDKKELQVKQLKAKQSS